MKISSTVIVTEGKHAGLTAIVEQIYGYDAESLIQVLLPDGKVKFLPRKALTLIKAEEPVQEGQVLW